MPKIHIVDSIMGSGKTSAAIKLMEENKQDNFIFITPFIKEITRVIGHKEEGDNLPIRNRTFVQPLHLGRGKLNSLHVLLDRQNCIASTHALFKQYNEYTIELLKQGNYTLILDEVCDVVEQIPLTKGDVNLLLETYAYVEDNFLIWKPEHEEYEGRFTDIKTMAMNKQVVVYGDCLLMWNFPVGVFEGFKEIYILTYLFKAQIQKYYYDYYNIEYDYWGVEKVNGEYFFVDHAIDHKYPELKNLVNILDEEKMNAIGDDQFALSVSWYRREAKNKNILAKKLKNNMINYFTNKRKPDGSELAMWTVFKEFHDLLKGKGYTEGHVSVTARATNDYKHKKNLAYMVNIFFNPIIKQFFEQKNVQMFEDEYALSEMIQWIWRGAIREMNPIWIYIPSRRMRTLLINWLEEVSK